MATNKRGDRQTFAADAVRVDGRPGETELRRRVDFLGSSGATYSFLPLEEGAPLRAIGVTYALAVPVSGAWRVLTVGETSNLADRQWLPPLEEARTRYPDAVLLIRLNINRSIR